MQPISTLLHELDEVYHAGNIDAYKQRLQNAATQVEHLYPGFTIAYAEIYTAGQDRYPHGGMRHILLPCLSSDTPGVQ